MRRVTLWDWRRAPYRQPHYTTCMDLGAHCSIFTSGWDRAVEASGPEVNARKRMINEQVIYPPEATSREEIFAARSIEETGAEPPITIGCRRFKSDGARGRLAPCTL